MPTQKTSQYIADTEAEVPCATVFATFNSAGVLASSARVQFCSHDQKHHAGRLHGVLATSESSVAGSDSVQEMVCRTDFRTTPSYSTVKKMIRGRHIKHEAKDEYKMQKLKKKCLCIIRKGVMKVINADSGTDRKEPAIMPNQIQSIAACST